MDDGAANNMGESITAGVMPPCTGGVYAPDDDADDALPINNGVTVAVGGNGDEDDPWYTGVSKLV